MNYIQKSNLVLASFLVFGGLAAPGYAQEYQGYEDTAVITKQMYDNYDLGTGPAVDLNCLPTEAGYGGPHLNIYNEKLQMTKMLFFPSVNDCNSFPNRLRKSPGQSLTMTYNKVTGHIKPDPKAEAQKKKVLVTQEMDNNHDHGIFPSMSLNCLPTESGYGGPQLDLYNQGISVLYFSSVQNCADFHSAISLSPTKAVQVVYDSETRKIDTIEPATRSELAK